MQTWRKRSDRNRNAEAVRLITTTPMVRQPDRPTGRITQSTTTMRMVHRQGHPTDLATRRTTIMPTVRRLGRPIGRAIRRTTITRTDRRREDQLQWATRPTTIMQMGHLPDRLLRWAGSGASVNGDEWLYSADSFRRFSWWHKVGRRCAKGVGEDGDGAVDEKVETADVGAGCVRLG